MMRSNGTCPDDPLSGGYTVTRLILFSFLQFIAVTSPTFAIRAKALRAKAQYVLETKHGGSSMKWDLRLPVRLCQRIAGRLNRDGWGTYRVGRWVIDALLLPSDIEKIRRIYTFMFGLPPRLLSPHTFNEKLQSSKIFHRKSRHVRFADKLAVRQFVRERIGPEVLTQIYWIGLDLEDARRQCLPNRFVLKANHSCNANLIVSDASLLDWKETEPVVRRWLAKDWSAHAAEWQYRWIPRKLFIEEYLEGPNGGVPMDYKFFCFHGRVEMVQVDVDRFSNHSRVLFDRNFNALPVSYAYPRYEGNLRRPACYEQMREIAEHLAAGELFLRVDLYDLGRPVFGEMTLTPVGRPWAV